VGAINDSLIAAGCSAVIKPSRPIFRFWSTGLLFDNVFAGNV
jgi:hypothetical protein